MTSQTPGVTWEQPQFRLILSKGAQIEDFDSGDPPTILPATPESQHLLDSQVFLTHD